MTENTEWTAIPAPPKVPNFHQGYGYTLHYASPGWDAHEGTHDTKETLGEVLFHARTAKEAKTWASEHPLAETPKPAKRARKPKAKAQPPAEDAPPADDTPEADPSPVSDGLITDDWNSPVTAPEEALDA